MLDNLNVTQVNTYKDMIELQKWLIEEKGREHHIEMIAFDTGDELALLADAETIRQSNIENPSKKCKSIKAAFRRLYCRKVHLNRTWLNCRMQALECG